MPRPDPPIAWLARRWRPLLAGLLVATAVAGYGLARRGGASGERAGAAPTATTAAGPTGSTVAPPASDGQGAAPPPTGGAAPAPGRGGTTGPTGTTREEQTETTRETTTRPSTSRHWVIQWVLSLGPDAPTTPAVEIEPYLLLLERDCAGALQSANTWFANQDDPRGAVYRGAASACLAAFHDQPQRWAAARRHLAIALAGAGTLRCAEQATLEWLEAVVGLHDEDRTRGFEAQAPQGFYSHVDRLDPDHGPAGRVVQVEGANLQCASGVRLEQGEEQVVADLEPDPSGRLAFFTVPEGLAPGEAELVVLGYIDDWEMGRAAFTYEAGG
jgi:hypothetical protein